MAELSEEDDLKVGTWLQESVKWCWLDMKPKLKVWSP